MSEKGISQIKEKLEDIIQKHGKWSAHNIHLGENIYTIGEFETGDEQKLRRIVQIITDISRKPLSELRILDLACLEGLYGIELARQGAGEVVAVDVRDVNIIKTQFAIDSLGLNNIKVIKDDVRNLNVSKYGKFDVILCLGILYHLDFPDNMNFISSIYDCTGHIAIFDTQVAVSGGKELNYNDKIYKGKKHLEHSPKADKKQRERDLWLSIDNTYSVWLNKSSLINFLNDVGFSSVFECYSPIEPKKIYDRTTLVAIRNENVILKSAPYYKENINYIYPYFDARQIYNYLKTKFVNFSKFHLRRILPDFLKDVIKKQLNK